MQSTVAESSIQWHTIGQSSDLVPNSGVGALVDGHSIAIFWLPDYQPSLFAISNICPKAQANIMARGIVGDVKGEPVIASPLYKQHFSLLDGRCLEEADLALPVWLVRQHGDQIQVAPATATTDQSARAA